MKTSSQDFRYAVKLRFWNAPNNNINSLITQPDTNKFSNSCWYFLAITPERRIIYDVMEELQYNRGFQTSKQTELFAPAMPFMALLRTTCDHLLREFKKYGDSKSVLYHVNQTALQIGWLIGYYLI